MLTCLIRAWVRSAYGRGARSTAWLYVPCLVGIRLIEQSLRDRTITSGAVHFRNPPLSHISHVILHTCTRSRVYRCVSLSTRCSVGPIFPLLYLLAVILVVEHGSWSSLGSSGSPIREGIQKSPESLRRGCSKKWLWFNLNVKRLEVDFPWSLQERSLWVAAWCHRGYFARSWLSHHHGHWYWQVHAIHDASASRWQKTRSSLSLRWRFCKLIRCSIIMNFCGLILMALKGGTIRKIVYSNDSGEWRHMEFWVASGRKIILKYLIDSD